MGYYINKDSKLFENISIAVLKGFVSFAQTFKDPE